MKTAICAIIKNEHRFLKEWIEWHLNLGFDAIHLFEDKESDSHEEICNNYSNVFLRRYENDLKVQDLLKNQGSSCRQLILYSWFAEEYKKQYDWIAFIDIDEFIIFEDNYTLNSFLSEYINYPAIHLSWRMKGASGCIKRPYNVMNYYTNDAEFLDTDTNWRVKSIINTNKYLGLKSLHHSIGGVDVNFKESDESIIYKKAWINHYFTKSWEDWCDRIFKRGSTEAGHRVLSQFFEINTDMLYLKDELMSSVIENKPAGGYWIDRKRKIIAGGNIKKIAQLNNKNNNFILIESNNGRFANQIYPIMIALSFYEKNKHVFNKIYFKNFYDEPVFNGTNLNYKYKKISDELLEVFPKLKEVIHFIDSEEEYNSIKKYNLIHYLDLDSVICDKNFNSNLLVSGNCQNVSYIVEDYIRDYFKVPYNYLTAINNELGDISNHVSIHIRRGDYLSQQYKNNYHILTVTYIKNVIKKHFDSNTHFICVSDDIKWCKNKLNFIDNITFIDDTKFINTDLNNTLIDFFIQTMCKANICSPSSFSMAAATLNINKNLIINDPYYKNEDFNKSKCLQITPKWATKEPLKKSK